MIYLEAEKTTKKYATRKTIAEIFDYKNPSKLLKTFRELADEQPHIFRPYKPYVKNTKIREWTHYITSFASRFILKTKIC